ALERVGEATCEVDQTLRQLGVRALEVEDDRDGVLELVGDLLRVVEAAWHDEVHARGRGACGRGRVYAAQARALLGLGTASRVGPVVVVALALARSDPPHIRATLLVASLELLGGGGVVVPFVLLGNPEVDEWAIPHISEGHEVSQCYFP